MQTFLHAQAKPIAAQVVALRARYAPLEKADIGPKELDAIEAILAGVDFAGWSVLVDDVSGLLAEIIADGSVAALAQIGITTEARADVFNVVNSYAVDHAKERAAEMVGMRVDELGRLVPNPNARWQITEGTRDYLRADVRAAITEGWSNDDLSAKIAESYGFSKERATVVARTETNRASNEGALESYKASGVVAKKSWITAQDDRVSEECEANGEAGEIGLDDNFPSGDPCPPVHPNCRCAIVPVVEWDEAGPTI